MKTILFLLGASTLSCAAFSQTLYDINFQTADQGLNQIVAVGALPDHVSQVLFGTPVVVPAYGPLTNQPLLFDSNGEVPAGPYYYTQIQLTMPSIAASGVDLSFDMFDTGSGHEMTVLFDTPTVRNFYFDNGLISFYRPFAQTMNFGTYQMGQAYRFDIHIDYLTSQWSFYENNFFVGSDAFNPDGPIKSIRFNYSAAGPNISGTAIDNILVTLVPEPASLAIAGLACCALLARQSYGKKNKSPGNRLD